MNAKPRIKDIALRANVSVATVSNAINGKGGVSEGVVRRVFDIAREIGYDTAKARAGGEEKHKFVRLIVYKSHGKVIMDTNFFAELIEGIQMECQRTGLELVISHVNRVTDGDYQQRIRDFCGEDLVGILLLATEMSDEELKLFSPCRSPLVALDNSFRYADIHSVVMDNASAGFQATTYLLKQGFQKIGHLTSNIDFHNMAERREGYERAMRLRGETSVVPLTPSIDGAYRDMKALLQKGFRPAEAYFAGNDLIAIGAMQAFTEHGLRVPEDVSIIGMDDTVVCMACTPALTTLRVSRKDMSMVAVRTLLNMLTGLRQSVIKTQIGVRLISRDSVKTNA